MPQAARALFPPRKMQALGMSRIAHKVAMAGRSRLSHSGMSCNRCFGTINRRACRLLFL